MENPGVGSRANRSGQRKPNEMRVVTGFDTGTLVLQHRSGQRKPNEMRAGIHR